MSPASRALIDRPSRTGLFEDTRDVGPDLQRLRADLARMRMYALALEERCHKLWAGLPASDGDRDPLVPFLALHCSMATPDAGDPA
jgi:hypothetical protein